MFWPFVWIGFRIGGRVERQYASFGRTDDCFYSTAELRELDYYSTAELREQRAYSRLLLDCGAEGTVGEGVDVF